MELKEREKTILGAVVEEYIKEAQPISSNFLVENYNFGLSSATLRLELQKLTKQGYLCQPHTSAGRVPTDKGYRFFIDELAIPHSLGPEEEDLIKNFFEQVKVNLDSDISAFNRNLIKIMAEISKDLVIVSSLDEEENEVYYEGVLNLFQKPEFQEIKQIQGIFKMLEIFRGLSEDFLKESNDLKAQIQVFIGKENPFYNTEDYSIIISRSGFSLQRILDRTARIATRNVAGGPEKETEIFAILGPKRMRYDKNISLLNFIANLKWRMKKIKI
ncbi:MAG: hypothetical protein COV69_01550 [Parcubacteria group bacterium CG11_big_fil_rev_8_21_14_0_20_39_14]|nr:MAG: hypothetical protein COV69_01550 [Parcubacteria group bacterium CG11_big_fil_rev_8_21_14_0_20_39_14]PIS35297.1 MAG: hypothetical protein COT36_03190 [Parcubacteria group bacterium CG08_land_8_20_14_0_20_38_56]